ncbi:MAG TPA: hypothetical protein VMD75_05920 [Candidatus Binataceae bacterium]|nr:hypothetical protein [Candidatus Binataceae bacterium]
MPSQQPFYAAARSPHHPSKHMLSHGGTRVAQLDSVTAPNYSRHAAEQFVFGEWRIVLAESVASRD